VAEPRILIVRLSSLGDLVHTLPAVHALRAAFPAAEMDWLVEARWAPLLAGNPDLSAVVRITTRSWRDVCGTVARLRRRHYDLAVDFQGLYKSALLAWLAGAKQRFGFAPGCARERGAALFYTRRVTPRARHVVEQNLELAIAAGARAAPYRFPLQIAAEARQRIRQQLAAHGVREYFVLSPGGGWRSKCWPAERYGELYRRLVALPALAGWNGVVNAGPGEHDLVEAVQRAAGANGPIWFPLELAELVALIAGAKFLVSGDSGPLHLAVALGVPVVGLYGPTDPTRNGPFVSADIVVRKARPEETSYRRENHYSAAMLAITVDEVVAAVERRLGLRS
jgi:heptosyltransferase-1